MAGGVRASFKLDTKESTAEVRQLLARVNESEAAFRKMTSRAQQLEQQLTRAGRSGRTEFQQLQRSIDNVPGRLLAIGAATQVVSGAFQEMTLRAEAARAEIDSVVRAEQRLAQVGGGRRQAIDLGARFGLRPDEARELVFQSKSLGIEGQDLDTIAASKPFAQPAVLAELYGLMREAFGADEIGNAANVIAKGLLTSQVTNIDLEKLTPAILGFASDAGRVGTSDEEAFALLAKLSPRFGRDPGRASTVIKAAAEELARAGITDSGIAGGLARFEAEQPEAFAAKVAGRSEFALAVDAVKKAGDEIAALADELGRRQGDPGVIAGAVGDATDAVRADIEFNKARARGEARRLDLGAQVKATDTAEQDFVNRVDAAGGSSIYKYLLRGAPIPGLGISALDLVGAFGDAGGGIPISEAFTEGGGELGERRKQAVLRQAEPTFGQYLQGTLRDFGQAFFGTEAQAEAARRMEALAERQARATERMVEQQGEMTRQQRYGQGAASTVPTMVHPAHDR